MPGPVRNAELRAPVYTVVPYSPDSTPATKDIILRLDVKRVQKDIASGAKTMFFPGFLSETINLGLMKFVITLEGWFSEEGVHASHTSTAVADGVPHVPDFIDLEEATIFFNHDANRRSQSNGLEGNLVELRLDYGKDGQTAADWRTYKGLILSTELIMTAGHLAGEFVMTFGVVWSDDNPTLREWA